MSEKNPFFHGQRSATDKFPNAVRVDNLIYTSGHVAMDENGRAISPDDCVAQADIIFGKLTELLATADTDMEHVVKITAFLTDKDDYPQYNEVRHRWFPIDPPASTTVVVKELVKPGLVVEIEAVAVVSK